MRYAPTRQKRIGKVVRFFALMARARVLGERFELVEELRDPAVCGVEVVASDVLPDFVEVQLSVDAEDVFCSCACFSSRV
jgi:hypothetical protein